MHAEAEVCCRRSAPAMKSADKELRQRRGMLDMEVAGYRMLWPQTSQSCTTAASECSGTVVRQPWKGPVLETRRPRRTPDRKEPVRKIVSARKTWRQKEPELEKAGVTMWQRLRAARAMCNVAVAPCPVDVMRRRHYDLTPCLAALR